MKYRRMEGEQVDCINGKAQLGDIPYRMHIAVRLGEAARDWALGQAKYNHYQDRGKSLKTALDGLMLEVMGWDDKEDREPKKGPATLRREQEDLFDSLPDGPDPMDWE